MAVNEVGRLRINAAIGYEILHVYVDGNAASPLGFTQTSPTSPKTYKGTIGEVTRDIVFRNNFMASNPEVHVQGVFFSCNAKKEDVAVINNIAYSYHSSFTLMLDARDKIANHGDLTYKNILIANNVFWGSPTEGLTSPRWAPVMTETTGLVVGEIAVWNNIFGTYNSDDEPNPATYPLTDVDYNCHYIASDKGNPTVNANSTNANPLFAESNIINMDSPEDFELRSGSPFIGSGKSGVVSYDYNWEPRNTVDIGAQKK